MISPTEREELKGIIGNRYSNRVLALLNTDNVISGSGKEYSIEYIRQVFNGHHSNDDVEYAIYELRDKILEKQKKLEQKKNTNPYN